MTNQIISILKNELPVFGKAYTLSNMSLIVINNKMHLEYLNDYAKMLLNLHDESSLKNQTFVQIWNRTKLPPLIDLNGKLMQKNPMRIKNRFKQWELIPVLIENKPCIFLVDKDVTENENIYKTIENEIISSIGYKSPNRLSINQYINEIANYYTSIINKIPCYVYWKNTALEYIGCNAMVATYYNFKSTNEIIGKNDFDLSPNHDLAESYRGMDRQIFADGKPIMNSPGELMNHNGDFLFTLVSKVPITDLAGKIIGIVGITVDVTDLEKAKKDAEAANHAKAEFIANMSHDIRTPLTGVIGVSKMIEDNAVDPNQKQYAHWVHESGDQLLLMFNGILDVISSDNLNEHDLHEETFELSRMIHDILQLERPSTLIKGIDFATHVDDIAPIYFISDHTKLQRILLNLVGNALKFTEKGCVTIDVKCLQQSETHALLQFRVSDTGIGIPLEMQDKVFDRFFRVTPSYKGLYTGHGVGLHISQSYAHLLGGEIKLTSEPGVGTTFYFDLSLKIGDVAQLHRPTQQPPIDETIYNSTALPEALSKPLLVNAAAVAQDAPNLLLIEDNAIALRVLENIITQSGCRFTSAVDGELALKLACHKPFDLIITDLGLPGLSGIELTKKIREFETSRSQKQTPIIGLTAHAQGKVRDECLASGMNDVFSKPMNIDTLTTIKSSYLTPRPPSPAPTNTTVSDKSTSALGPDLPNTEQELFELDAFPVFDEQLALEQVGNDRSLLLNVLHDFVEKQIPGDITLIKDAYNKKNWDLVEQLAHKIKGGVLYCGTIQMKYACQYLERYRKAGHKTQLDSLYHQLIQVTEISRLAVIDWLNKQTIT